MILSADWLARDLWTLIEAAQICSGLEPYLGGPVTDSPHDIVPRIADVTARANFELLYGRSKDAADLGKLPFVRSRTGKIGNTRVRPAEYLAWAIDNGHPVSPDVKLPMKPSPPVEQSTEAMALTTSDTRHSRAPRSEPNPLTRRSQ